MIVRISWLIAKKDESDQEWYRDCLTAKWSDSPAYATPFDNRDIAVQTMYYLAGDVYLVPVRITAEVI